MIRLTRNLIVTKLKVWLSIAIFIVSLFILVNNISDRDQHGDEKIYIWKSGYYGNRIISWNFSPGTNNFSDPGFNPSSFWAWEQPFGSHIIYALTMGITSSPPPALPYSYEDPNYQSPETLIPHKTLLTTRSTAALCAALGMSLLTMRFGWEAIFPLIILLAIPSTRDSFSRAWAEGPLMLGFGLCAISFRSRWFPYALGIATSFKLTALGLWPLLMMADSCGKEFRWRKPISIVTSLLVFSFLNPISWFFLGPLFIIIIIIFRILTWYQQSNAFPTFQGIFFPPRYAWPFELLGLLLITHIIFKFITKQWNKDTQS